MKQSPSIALVHDRLNVRGGAEKFLEQLAQLYPRAPIYSVLYDPHLFAGSEIAKHKVQISFINRLPQAKRRHRIYMPLMPLAIEQFDLSEYDIILSSSAGFAHGVLTRPNQLHLSYMHSSIYYVWGNYSQFGLTSLGARIFLPLLRHWDHRASQRPNVIIANSQWTAACIRQTFGRDSKVIYPPVEVEDFNPAAIRDNFYFTVARLVPYKRVDLIVKAFARLGLPLVVVGDGAEFARIKRMATPNIRFLGEQNSSRVAALAAVAKAFVFAAEDFFGIAAVEAQAAGCPVIAYGRGGLRETVLDGKTGIFFNEQTVESLMEAVERFESGKITFEQEEICANASRFGADKFRENFRNFVDQRWEEFQKKISSN